MWRPVFAPNTGEQPNPQFQSSRLTAVALDVVLATVPELKLAHRNNESCSTCSHTQECSAASADVQFRVQVPRQALLSNESS